MGAGAGLLGHSSRALSIFLSEVKHCRPDAVVHECTGRFMKHVFEEYLGEYDVYSIKKPEAGSRFQSML